MVPSKTQAVLEIPNNALYMVLTNITRATQYDSFTGTTFIIYGISSPNFLVFSGENNKAKHRKAITAQ